MNDDDLIRRGDAIAVAARAELDFADPYWTLEQIRALPAVQVAVKPLEWDQLDGLPEYDIWEVLTVFGRYKVQQASANAYALLVYPNGTICQQPTIEAAKAAAQANYDARIRSSLTAQPSPDVAALVEAAEKLLDAYSSIVGPGNPWGDELRAALARLKGGAA